jgi:hypothetical protein
LSHSMDQLPYLSRILFLCDIISYWNFVQNQLADWFFLMKYQAGCMIEWLIKLNIKSIRTIIWFLCVVGQMKLIYVMIHISRICIHKFQILINTKMCFDLVAFISTELVQLIDRIHLCSNAWSLSPLISWLIIFIFTQLFDCFHFWSIVWSLSSIFNWLSSR